MLYEKDNYVMSIPFLINSKITEYDMSKANISMLLEGGLITIDKANELLSLDKKLREIKVGLMQANDDKVKDCINNGFSIWRKAFIEIVISLQFIRMLSS